MADVKRRYHSPVRAESSRRTRRAVVEAATALFVEQGYAATSLRHVGERAGVARPTVTAAFGSKGALLREVLDQALAGDDEPVPVARRAWFQPVWDARDPAAVLEAYAGVCVLIGGRAGALFEVVHRAAGDGGEVSRLWDTVCRNRLAGARMVCEQVVRTGATHLEGDLERAVDVVWVHNDPGLPAALVTGRGWTPDEVRRYLADQMVAGVLRDRGGPSR